MADAHAMYSTWACSSIDINSEWNMCYIAYIIQSNLCLDYATGLFYQFWIKILKHGSLPCLHICPYCDSILNWYFYLQLQDLQSELEMDRQEKGELKQQIDTQCEELDSCKMQAVEVTIKQENETDSLKTIVQDQKTYFVNC